MKQYTARTEIKIILGMLVTVALPIGITHAAIKGPPGTPGASPFGYTVSLLLFLVPILVITAWHMRSGHPYDKKAFFWSAGIMAAIGTVLDIAFGYHFFVFNNQSATLGIRIPAWNWADMSFVPDYLPIEEFGFYILGGIFMAAAYLWAGKNWVAQESREDYEAAAAANQKLIQVSPPAAALWIVIFVSGMAYFVLQGAGFPGYFVFVMVGGAAPTLFLIRSIGPFVNWHAMTFAFFALLFLSVIWEASLAIPYEWWGYKGHEMLGIYIQGWSGLPIEAVMVWALGVWDAVLIFEFMRIFFRMDLAARHRFFGTSG